jgi:hypothetical protein
MYRIVSVFLAAFVMLSTPTIVVGQTATMTFNFQGRLNDSGGNPVPDGNYQMMFFIYSDSTGGTPLWTESHPAVHVGGGVFSLDLGTTTPCSLSLATRPNIYLATQIGSLPPLAHRLKITKSPNSAVAQRIYGDLQTQPGSLVIREPLTAQSSISLNTGTEAMGIVIEDRPTDLINGRSIRAGIDSGEVTFGLNGPNGQQLLSSSAKPGSLGRITWGLFNPQPEPPGYEAHALLEASTGPSGKASWVMFNPQPEPPGSDPFKLIEISNNIGGDAGIYMFNPQPEPPGSDPFFGLSTTSNGPNLNMYAPQVGGTALVNNHPQLRMRCDSSSTELLLQRGFASGTLPPESTGVYIHADSGKAELRVYQANNPQLKITSNANGATMSFIDDGSEYMGVEPSPWHSGGDLMMSNAAGGVTLLLASNGMVSIGTGNHTNILTIQQSSPTDPIADAWTVYSSRRWKTNIQPLQGSLDKVMRLNGVSYDWKENGKHDIGLIAEDVGKVVPEVVAYEDNGVDAKSVDYSRLTALLIEAVKEQQMEIKLLNENNEMAIQKISKLEAEISQLKGR